MLKPINYEIELDKDEEFWNIAKKLSDRVEEIIETGTYFGTGSTRVFAITGKKVKTIECNKEHYNIAKENLAMFENVEVYHGFSLKKIDMFVWIQNDDIYEYQPKEDIMVDYYGNSKSGYMKEINQVCEKENLLWEFINNPKRQLIFLDSAGGVGYMEFQKVMELPSNYLKNKILMMDDLKHVKHYRSKVYLEKLGYNLNLSREGRFGWIDFQEVLK